MSFSLIGTPSRSAVACAALIATTSLVAWRSAGPASAQEAASSTGRSFAQPALRQSTFPKESRLEAPVAPVAGESGGLRLAGSKSGTASPPPATTSPSPTAKVEPSWPKTVPEAKAEAAPPQVEVYSEQEIAAAKEHCTAVLKGLEVVIVEEAPFKSGACGAPAPVQLVSLGRSPQVTLSPPVTVTCDMVAAMHKWVTQDVQPLAKKFLGAQVVGIETMSSYSCRNAYGRKKTNLSEHGRANALDIRSFATADAKETAVLADWGPTGWEIRAQIAAATKAAAEKLAAEKAAAEKAAAAKALAAGQPGQQQGGKAATATGSSQQPAASATGGVDNLVSKIPSIANRLPGAAPAAEGNAGFGLMRPSYLGGPKAAKEPPVPATGPLVPQVDVVSQSRRAQFLRAAHSAACKIFGTTLGPETNPAHKNHFHVDMAERSRGNYCE
jgi:hypothetical protein